MNSKAVTELRRLAEAATPGPRFEPWRVEADPGQECSECGTHDSETWIVRRSDGAGVAVVLALRAEAIARYIAAASPSVVLALLDRVERAERKAETHERDWYEAKSEFGTAMAKMREALRAAERRELDALAELDEARADAANMRRHYGAAAPEHNLLALLDLYEERARTAEERETNCMVCRIREENGE